MMSRARVTYAEAGRAGRAFLAKTSGAKPALSWTESRVAFAIVSLLPLYSKLEDRVTLDQIAKTAAIPGSPKTRRREVSRALQSLVNRNVGLIYEPGQGRGMKSRIAVELPEKKTGQRTPLIDSEKAGPSDEKGGSLSEKKAGSAPPESDHTEKVLPRSTSDPTSESEVLDPKNPASKEEPSPPWRKRLLEAPHGARLLEQLVDGPLGLSAEQVAWLDECETCTEGFTCSTCDGFIQSTLGRIKLVDDLLDVVEIANRAQAESVIVKALGDGHSGDQVHRAIKRMETFDDPPRHPKVLTSVLRNSRARADQRGESRPRKSLDDAIRESL